MLQVLAATPAEISGVLAGGAALIASVVAFIKFGLGERGTLTITQAQGANTILNSALESLNKELERKQDTIDSLERERDALKLAVNAYQKNEENVLAAFRDRTALAEFRQVDTKALDAYRENDKSDESVD